MPEVFGITHSYFFIITDTAASLPESAGKFVIRYNGRADTRLLRAQKRVYRIKTIVFHWLK